MYDVSTVFILQTYLDNIKDEIKQEIKDKEIKLDVPAVNILDGDSI